MRAQQLPPAISIRGVCKFFGSFQALKDVSLEVYPGERVVVCGPSGSGKSTLIRCINQLEKHESGDIRAAGVALTGGSDSLRRIRAKIGMVFQQFNLFPHLTVMDNLTLGPMRARNMPREQAETLARNYLERVKIPEQAGKYPRQLSGSMHRERAMATRCCWPPDSWRGYVPACSGILTRSR